MISAEWVTLFLLFAGVIAGISLIRQLDQDLKYLTYFVIVAFTLELMANCYTGIYRKNNLFLYHLLIPFQYLTLAFVFRENILSQNIKNNILLSVVFVFLFALFSGIFFQKLTEMPFLVILITRLLLLIWVLIYLKDLLNTPEPEPLTSVPTFYVSIGVFVSIISLFQMGVMHYLISDNRELIIYWLQIILWFDAGFYLLCVFPLLYKAFLKYKGLITNDGITF